MIWERKLRRHISSILKRSGGGRNFSEIYLPVAKALSRRTGCARLWHPAKVSFYTRQKGNKAYIIAQSLRGIAFEKRRQGVEIIVPRLEYYDRMHSSVLAPRFRDQLAVQDVLHNASQAVEGVVEIGVRPMSIFDVRIQLGQSIVRPQEQVGHVLLGDVRPPIYKSPQFAPDVVQCVHLALHPRL